MSASHFQELIGDMDAVTCPRRIGQPFKAARMPSRAHKMEHVLEVSYALPEFVKDSRLHEYRTSDLRPDVGNILLEWPA